MHWKLALFCFLLACATANAQLTAHGSISLTARLPSSVSLSETMLPVTITVAAGQQMVSKSTVHIKWNINRHESSGYRIVGTLVGNELPGGDFETRLNEREFRPFSEIARRVVLDYAIIGPNNGQGTQQSTIEVKIKDNRLDTLTDGTYRGWIKLEAELL